MTNYNCYVIAVVAAENVQFLKYVLFANLGTD